VSGAAVEAPRRRRYGTEYRRGAATKDAAPDTWRNNGSTIGNPEGRAGDGAIAALLVVSVLQYASSSRLALSPSPARRDLAAYRERL